jgi:protein-tyrosine phosphatase
MERLDIDWLTESLAVGGCFPVSAAADLARAHGINCVVDLRAEACDDDAGLRRHGMSFLHLPTPDRCAIAPAAIEGAVAWIARALDAGARVLVHCEYGIGRSVLLALCVLVHRGHAPLDAMTLLKETRPVASPSPEQLRAFLAFAGEHRRISGGAWPVPSFDAVAAIAYRHLATGVGSGTASAGG